MASRVVSVDDLKPAGFRWLTLKRIHWEDPHGRRRIWESAERTTRRGDVDGVAIVAKILRRGQPPVIPVLKQYRPPINAYCLELPAGLVDADETAGEAAVRELLEETGFSGRVDDVSPVCSSDPGMSNANMNVVVLAVDGDAPENQNVKQQLEDGEFIQVELVPWHGLLQHLKEEVRQTRCSVDARLLSYAIGIEHAKEIANLAVAAAAAATVAGATSNGIGTTQQQHQGVSLGSFGSPVAPAPLLCAQASGYSGSVDPPALALVTQASSAAGKHTAVGSSGGQLQGLLGSRSSWLLFAAGWMAGTAGCWLLLGRSSRGA